MKLELGKIFIKDIRFDDKTHVKDGSFMSAKRKLKRLSWKMTSWLAAMLTSQGQASP